jgi:hypothetical protein
LKELKPDISVAFTLQAALECYELCENCAATFFKKINKIAMNKKENQASVAGGILLILVFLNAVILKTAFIKNENWYIALLITLPLALAAGIKLYAEKKVSSN